MLRILGLTTLLIQFTVYKTLKVPNPLKITSSLKRGRFGLVPQRRGKPLDQAKHLRLGVARGVAVRIEALGERATSAEPTTTPSAMRASALTCSFGLHAEADRDRQIGCALMRPTWAPTAAISGAAVPVMPAIET